MFVPIQAVLITALAVLAAAAGVWLAGVRGVSRRLVPVGGVVLLAVALFWILPEIAEFLTWPVAGVWMAGGFALVFTIDRFVYPVCPACSHTHDHDDCATRLHGFATPLLIAAGLHAMLDGWTASSARGVSAAVVWAVALHKAPEGLALGVIARASVRSRGRALAWCALAESMTMLGAAIGSAAAPHLGVRGLYILLAVAGGTFLYLGGHAVHGSVFPTRAPGISPAAARNGRPT